MKWFKQIKDRKINSIEKEINNLRSKVNDMERQTKSWNLWNEALPYLLQAEKWAVLYPPDDMTNSLHIIRTTLYYGSPFEEDECLNRDEMSRRGYIYQATIYNREIWIVPKKVRKYEPV